MVQKMKSNRIAIFFILLFTIAAFATFSGCSKADSSSLHYLDQKITIVGVSDEDFTVTVSNLTKLDRVEKKAEATRSNGDIVKMKAVGPTLETFLAQYDKLPTDYSSVRFTATDGYSIAIPREILERREIVLAYMDGKHAFGKDMAPLRVVVLGERAMYWARMVNKIEFETGTESLTTDKVVFLDTILPDMNSTYSEEEGGDIVSTIDLLTKYGGLDSDGKVYMSAYDGLKKNETIDNFLKGYIKYTGEMTPQFCSPDLPPGMNLDGIVSARVGGVIYYSLNRALEVLPEKEAAGVKGIGFTDIIKDGGFKRANLYQITDKDGNYSVFNEHEIVKGVFTKDNDTWTFVSAEKDPVIGVVMVEGIDMEQGE
ncbi:MAG: hypothetical protein LBN22_06750 [Clostridiales Family XIII bacterium]|jgi:hypothetical protein|nr:hypothetical protein [Clostridiales Family XIII bacterium]